MLHTRIQESIPSLTESRDDSSSNGSVQAAIARTASRSLALYFARPVRLFRPAKVNGWQTLKNLAKHQGQALSPQYLLSLVKLNGVGVIPKHFFPPMVVNATLGFVLWESYGVAASELEPYLSSRSLANAAMSGAAAGACQAVIAAPAENVRLLLEGGSGGHSWSNAWKEVFQEKTPSSTTATKSRRIHDIRELRTWFQEIGQMAGRGWEGWGWGCAKDAAGFAAFFCIFEVSRRAGTKGKNLLEERLFRSHCIQEGSRVRQLPAIVNGITLVSGGVFAGLAYELTCRPFDIARRTIYLDRIERPESSCRIIQRRFMNDGIRFFFQTNIMPHPQPTEQPTKWTGTLRTIGRVGPWGIGFLVWEAYGPST